MNLQLTTMLDFVRWGASRFHEADLYFGHGRDNAFDEAMDLVLHALHLPHGLPNEYWHCHVTESEKSDIMNLLQRRIDERLPAAYITHQGYFAGLEFYVDERVLVPRSPMAELIENRFSGLLPDEPANILDLCTGSGCIGIATAHHLPGAYVDCADISEEALEVAQINLDEHDLWERVSLIQSDGLDHVGTDYDLIISNPPYVDMDDLAMMPDEYHREPEIGLGSGPDGLDLTRKILRDAAKHLTEYGHLIVEVGASQHNLQLAYPEVPFNWLEFERGGMGVFHLTAAQLREYQSIFDERAKV